MDRAWWKCYGAEAEGFGGEKIAPIAIPGTRREEFKAGRSSGEGAIRLAAHRGARRIVMLGYDAQHTGGRAHWHPDHPRMGNAGAWAKWPEHFRALARQLGKSVTVINASRVSAIDAFPRMTLEDALGERDRSRGGEAPAARVA